MPRRFQSARNRAPRRLTQWGGTTVAATAFANVAPSSKVILLSIDAATLAAITPFTLVRTRGMFAVQSDQQAASEFQLGAFGMAFVTDAALAAGAASIPGPQTDSSWDGWHVFQPFIQRMVFQSGIGLYPEFAIQYEIDSKSMRKVEDEMALVLMVENASAAHQISVAANIRNLFKLH